MVVGRSLNSGWLFEQRSLSDIGTESPERVLLNLSSEAAASPEGPLDRGLRLFLLGVSQQVRFCGTYFAVTLLNDSVGFRKLHRFFPRTFGLLGLAT